MFLLRSPPQLQHTGQDVSIHDVVVRPFLQYAKDLSALGWSAQAILQFMRCLDFRTDWRGYLRRYMPASIYA